MPIDWNKIAEDAATDTDAEFKNKMSSLTRLNEEDITSLINETGIENPQFAAVIQVVNDAATSNNEKANAIQNITNGVDLLVGIAKKFI